MRIQLVNERKWFTVTKIKSKENSEHERTQRNKITKEEEHQYYYANKNKIKAPSQQLQTKQQHSVHAFNGTFAHMWMSVWHNKLKWCQMSYEEFVSEQALAQQFSLSGFCVMAVWTSPQHSRQTFFDLQHHDFIHFVILVMFGREVISSCRLEMSWDRSGNTTNLQVITMIISSCTSIQCKFNNLLTQHTTSWVSTTSPMCTLHLYYY